MRTLLLVALGMVACAGSRDTADGPDTMRERLEADTRLLVTAEASGAAISAQRRTGDGWAERLVDLPLVHGELVARADGGMLALDKLQLSFAPVMIPATLVGHEAQLADLRLTLAQPVAAPAVWRDDAEVSAETRMQLVLSWQLTVDGVGLPLGAPALPPLPVTVALHGSGAHVAAEVQIEAPGELWSWAGLVKLTDLMLVVDAETL